MKQNGLLDDPFFAPQVLNACIARPDIGRRAGEKWGRPARRPPFYTLFAVRSGTVTVTVSGDEQRIDAPCVLLFQPDQDYHIDLPALAEFAWIDWGVLRWELPTKESGERMTYRRKQPQPDARTAFDCELPWHLVDEDVETVWHLCANCMADRYGPGRWFQANQRLGQWLVGFLDRSGVNAAGADDSIGGLINQARQNLTHVRSATEWARFCGLHYRQLSRLLLDHHGLNGKETLDQLRVDRIRELLDEGHQIEDVALKVGCNSRQSLTRLFRRITGLSPRQWCQRSIRQGGC
jgi:AraC-like DNA-binding protein